MPNQALLELVNKYRPRGVALMDELLLSAEDALRLCDELEALNVPISGVNLWYYAQARDQQILAQDHQELSMSDAVLQGENPVSESVAMAKHFIAFLRPPRTAFVSLAVDEPEWVMGEDEG